MANSDLISKVTFTFLCLVIYRFGSYIPIPGIDPLAMASLAQANEGGILGMLNMLSGGSLSRMSIFALAIMPYITSSIVIQLLSSIYKPLEDLKKEGGAGKQKVNQLTRYLTVILAAVQSYGIATSLLNTSVSANSIVFINPLHFKVIAVLSMVVGTIFLMWLGEQISARGIGNGTSLIIFTGIITGMPGSIARLFELTKSGAVSSLMPFLVLIGLAAAIVVIILFERAQRRVQIQYPKRTKGMKVFGGDTTHLPIKINSAGVIPPIFASSLLLFPLTIVNFSQSDNEFLSSLAIHLGHGRPLYILLYVALIMFFAFFYTAMIFNSKETADNLKKYGAYVPGRRPGEHTANYFDFVLTRLTVVGSLYLAFICALPEIIIAKFSIPFTLGGTGLLILVNVVIDTFIQIQSQMYSQQYESLIKKAKLRERKK